jgi:hypothetical protein
MEHIRISVMNTRISLVICLIDTHTANTPLGPNIHVQLAGIFSKPVKKPNGSYIFSDLPKGSYQLSIRSEHYFDEELEVVVDVRDSVCYVPLTPLPSYPFKQGSSLLRMGIKEGRGHPLAGAKISAILASEDCARARLAQDDAKKGSTELTVGSITGHVGVGDRFLIKGRGSKEGEEVCRISKVLEHQKRFQLERPLERSYIRGSLLLPIVQSRSTDKGEAVIAFTGIRTKVFQVKLEVTCESTNSRSLLKEVMAEEGTTTNMGNMVL